MILEPMAVKIFLAYLDSLLEASSLTPIATIVPVSNLVKSLINYLSLPAYVSYDFARTILWSDGLRASKFIPLLLAGP